MPTTFRFTLRTLLLSTAGIGIAITVWQTLGPALGLTLLLLLSVVFTHVAGNALGSHLRATSAQRAREAVEQGLDELPPLRKLGERPVHAPVTRLSERTSLGWFLPCVTTAGGIGGAVASGWWMATYQRHAATMGAFVVGCGAAGVLAGLLTFWVFSLLQVFVGAWWQARDV